MDEQLKSYEVKIDQQALQQVKLAGRELIKIREDKFEESMISLVLKVIPHELQLYVIVASIQTIIMFACLPWVDSMYLIIGLHSFLLGAYMLFELFRTFRYRMCELQYPTKLGMSRLFLYKAILVLVMELIFISVLILGAYSIYGGNGYQLIAYGILPNLCMCGILFLLASRLHSIFVMLILYGGGVILMYAGIYQLLLRQASFLLSPTLIVLLVVIAIFCIGSMMKLQRQMKEEGGQLVWN